MSVEFFEDKSGEQRWNVSDDGDIIHSCHEGFKRRNGALQNLFLNHAMMSVFVRGLAGSEKRASDDNARSRVQFDIGKDDKVWWKIYAVNGEPIGKSHMGFDSEAHSIDNLIMTYTMLSMYIAMHAQENNTE